MIYFDNAASTKINDEVLSSYVKFAQMMYANPSSNHGFGFKANEYEAKARHNIASLFNKNDEEIIFTSGASESNNLAIKGTCLQYQNRGKHIITTSIEHASCLEAFKQLEEKFGFQVTYLKPDKNGRVSVKDVIDNIKEDTIFISIMAVNNEIGSINDIETIAKEVKKYKKIFFHSDITQAVAHMNLNLENVDLASFSLHKLNGFKGSGILIKRENINLLPLISGGGQEFNYRSGTNNLPLEVSAAKTLRLAFDDFKNNYKHILNLHDYLIDELKKIDGVRINSPSENFSPYIINFSLNKKASVVVEALSKKEIYVSTKSACSSKKSSLSYVLKEIGLDDFVSSNAIRVSFSSANTKEEIDIFIKELKKILESIYR